MKDGMALEFVPENLKTVELCLEAVKQDGWALRYVPWGQLNLNDPAMAEMCLAAVKEDGSLLKYVPENFKTVELWLEAVKKIA